MMYTDRDSERIYPEDFEETDDIRSEFHRDLVRLRDSPSLRRLEGKTQLFPRIESDFFRNRLTHSIEVSSIAERIAIRLNKQLAREQGEYALIDLDLINFAGMAHDLGHPPFGHQGEEQLNKHMEKYGGFEGNAQTFRILTKLEKKVVPGGEDYTGLVGIDSSGKDERRGLNLTYRSLASILKYDWELSIDEKKGYYSIDRILIEKIKHQITGGKDCAVKPFKTIECQIMDIADDIAYSTSDLEDAFKGKFINPFDILTANGGFYEEAGESIKKEVEKKGLGTRQYDTEKILNILSDIFKALFDIEGVKNHPAIRAIEKYNVYTEEILFLGMQFSYGLGKLLAENAYLRRAFFSQLVTEAINSITISYNTEFPALSKLKFNLIAVEKIEVLKQVAFQTQILSTKLKIAEYRGMDIVKIIFKKLEKGGHQLLPEDFRELYLRSGKLQKHRIICDFVACMTDRYAIEFFGRLTSENPETIFKPL